MKHRSTLIVQPLELFSREVSSLNSMPAMPIEAVYRNWIELGVDTLNLVQDPSGMPILHNIIPQGTIGLLV